MSKEEETLEQEAQETELLDDEENIENSEDTIETDINEDESDDKKDIDDLSDEEFLNYLETVYKPSSPNTDGQKEPIEQDFEEDTKSKPKKVTTNSNIYKDSSKNTSKNDPISNMAKNTTTSNVDYKSEYEKIFKPFKANGKEITPNTSDDVISLMQMGANYTKKMQLLAPYKRAVETLNKNNITEEELSYLIDLRNGNKEAIKTLLKEKNIDFMDLDLDDIKYHKNNNNIASDSEVQFSEALTEANDSLPRINEIMNKTWDAESKRILLTDPKALRGLHEEIQMGRFDTIQAMVDRERTFGRYKGIPDIQLYSMIATEMDKQKQDSQTIQQQNRQEAIRNQASKTKRNESKKRAAPTGKTTTKNSSSLTIKDLLSMPEEEFLKLSEKNLY